MLHRIVLIIALTLCILELVSCCTQGKPSTVGAQPTVAAIRPAEDERLVSLARPKRSLESLRLGSDRLFDPEYFPLIAGKRAAIMANQTSRSTVDRLIDDRRTTLVAIFAPEHGFWGAAAAGQAVEEARYRGVPVHACYGGGDDTRRIPTELLKDVDVLLFEVQDIGTRHYTFISSMYLAMDSAADAGIPFVVLDRPAGVNGADVEGPLLESEFQTFVGVARLPNRYGMTTGELALLFKHENALMDGPRYPRKKEGDAYWNVKDLKLFVLPMSGYDRTRCADEQAGGPGWIPPSPNIPSVNSALCYVGTGLFDGNTIAEMVGGYEQFVFIGVPFVKDDDELRAFIAAARRHYDFPGVSLEPHVNVRTGRDDLIKFEITDRARFSPTYAAIALLYTQAKDYPEKTFFTSAAGRRTFSLVCGNAWLGVLFADSVRLPAFTVILDRLEKEADDFKTIRNRYLLY